MLRKPDIENMQELPRRGMQALQEGQVALQEQLSTMYVGWYIQIVTILDEYMQDCPYNIILESWPNNY